MSRLARPLADSVTQELGSESVAATAGGVRRLESDSGTVEAHRLRGRTGFVGWLVVSLPDEVTQVARLLINQSVSLATLRQDQPEALKEARASLGAGVLGLLLEGGPMVPIALSGLRHLGMAPDEDVRLLWISGRARGAQPTSAARQLSSAGIPHAATTWDSGVAVMVHDKVYEAALDIIGGVQAADTVGSIGGSSVVPPAHCASALAQAQRAGRIAEQSGSKIRMFDTLGLESIIADDAIHDQVQALTDHMVAPLLGSSRSSAENLRTIRAFLDNNGAWEPAARELGIHRHTLRSRIARIEGATNLNMGRAEDRALLLVAIISHEH